MSIDPPSTVTIDPNDWTLSNWDSPQWLEDAVARTGAFSNKIDILSLLPIYRHPHIDLYTLNGTAKLIIRDFNVKHVMRDITLHPVGGQQSVPVPEPVTPHPMPTRWDMGLSRWFSQTGGKQRITMKFLLDDPSLAFLWNGNFPITAKNRKSQLMLASPQFDRQAGNWVSVDLLLDPADPSTHGAAEYNVAVVVTDERDSRYKLPIIIDPRSENRG